MALELSNAASPTTPNPRTGLVTLPEVITGDLAVKFGEISLYNQHADF
jgi:hypothetical protein